MNKVDKVNNTSDITGTGIIEQINNSNMNQLKKLYKEILKEGMHSKKIRWNWFNKNCKGYKE